MVEVAQIAKNAKDASIEALQLTDEIKNLALKRISQALSVNRHFIMKANKLDLDNAQSMLESGELSQSAYNRLKLDDNKLRDMIQGVQDIINLENPINKVFWEKEIADGIKLEKISCPIGVIGVIFEARPDVISQITALAIKSSNAVILKGGSEAVHTNMTIFDIINNALSSVKDFPQNMINLIFSREDVSNMLNLDKYINLIIPRGSNNLVKYIKANTKIPVLGHADGICHIYIDETADISKTINICIDSKCQYPSACNSVETILINKNAVENIMEKLLSAFKENDVKVLLNEKLKQKYPDYELAIENDWYCEYGDKIISIKQVDSLQEAVEHINTYGSGHTDCIITEDINNANIFQTYVDSAGVYHNISTRFADGFRYGFGAEVGISTNKTHARGPVGLDGLTIYKYKLSGSGDIVNDFICGKRFFNK